MAERLCCICLDPAPKGIFLIYGKGRANVSADADAYRTLCDACVYRVEHVRKNLPLGHALRLDPERSR